jgi:hypothetical protein
MVEELPAATGSGLVRGTIVAVVAVIIPIVGVVMSSRWVELVGLLVIRERGRGHERERRKYDQDFLHRIPFSFVLVASLSTPCAAARIAVSS